tara:strand:- start:5048 stop:5608 length:561 start_codon:yes stop_codon:yes gene_type:complete
MKKIITFIIIAGFTLTSFAQEKLKIDNSKSNIQWYGYYTFYFGGHEGTVDLKEGHFIKTNDKITGGEFVIDMISITGTDNGKIDTNSGLIKHLKNADFFDINKHPLAKLLITKVAYRDPTHARLEADLIIKGVTKSINFQAEFNFEELTMTTKFKIDRTRWGITYNSKMKDGALSDAIGFEIKISL